MPDHPTITEALAAVMSSVSAVAKNDRNEAQRFDFRGIDSVVNAVGPALREHGVIMIPHAGIPQSDQYESRNGAQMTHVVLPVTFTFHGPAGDTLDCQVYGEASDAGDKVLSKAHAVAWRIAMLQVFAIPTDDPDPDSASHERATPAQAEQRDWFMDNGWDSQTEHDAALEQNKARAKSLSDPKAHAQWLKDNGFKAPYPRSKMELWADELDRLTGVDPDACEYCGEIPCECSPPDDLSDAEVGQAAADVASVDGPGGRML